MKSKNDFSHAGTFAYPLDRPQVRSAPDNSGLALAIAQGASDRFARANALLADALPHEQVFMVLGKQNCIPGRLEEDPAHLPGTPGALLYLLKISFGHD